jgi:hypothetical protein
MFRRFVAPLTEKELNQFLEENARIGGVGSLSGTLWGHHRACGKLSLASHQCLHTDHLISRHMTHMHTSSIFQLRILG